GAEVDARAIAAFLVRFAGLTPWPLAVLGPLPAFPSLAGKSLTTLRPPRAAASRPATLSPPLAASGFCRALIPVKLRQAHAQQGATQYLHGAAAVLSVLPEVGPTRDQVTRGHREALLCNVIQCR